MIPQNCAAILPSCVSQAPSPLVPLKKLPVNCPTAEIAEPTLVAIFPTLEKTLPRTLVIQVPTPTKALVIAVPICPSPRKFPRVSRPICIAVQTYPRNCIRYPNAKVSPLMMNLRTGPKNPPGSIDGPLKLQGVDAVHARG